jgi:putative tricarboxylic transport membrane protein
VTGRLLALAVLAASGVYLASAWPLPQGTLARPGPGFYPIAVALFGTVVALAWVVSAFRRGPAMASVSTLEGPSLTRVIATAGLLVGFCLFLPWTGYLLASLLFTGLMLRGLGAAWRSSLIVGLGTAAVSYYVFATLLGVPLPGGVLFD